MQLLVSVAGVLEARAALAGGADVIDAKDPRRGALGAVGPGRLRAIGDAVAGRRPLSAALGDAPDRRALGRAACAAEVGLAYVKIGFRGVTAAALPRLADAARRATSARLILVAYADWRRAGAPSPRHILEAAARTGGDGVLLDTAFKDARLLDLMSRAALGAWVAAVREAGLVAAVAGSLNGADLGVIRRAGVDIAGVRGAACEGGRTGRVSEARVAALSALARGAPLARARALV
jgi:(5-formylfuran-3-yl)methyl phosphate synthase